MAVDASFWRLTLADIHKGNGIVTVTLRSGAVFSGLYHRDLSKHETLRLKQGGGYVDIDWDEIAALAGSPRPV